MRRTVALIGMPGSGKSTVGPLLAARLGVRFVDLDDRIVEAAERPVSGIFAEEGEAGFRRREREALSAVLDEPPCVLAVGGGAFVADGAAALLRERTTTVLLRAELSTLIARTAAGGRPLLDGDRQDALARLLTERRDAYASADIHLDAEAAPEAVAEAALAALGEGDVIVPVGGARPYEVRIGSGLLRSAGARVRAAIPTARRAALVTDANVDVRYGARVEEALREAGLEVDRIVLAPGEGRKSWEGLRALCDRFAAMGLGRSDVAVALGGGVVGDLTGFAAAVHMRGIDWVQLPTTLLAQVDSSVGGKTAIDTAAGKNLVGAFWPPRLVLADLDVLATLPTRELRGGYAEVVKYGLLGDADFFAWLEAHGTGVVAAEPMRLREAVRRCVEMKAAIVAEDEREQGRRALLNLGHTFGHALEAEAGYEGALSHGEAVAVGCAMAFRLSAREGLCALEAAERGAAVLAAGGLPTRLGDLSFAASADRLLARMAGDKKASAAGLTLILVEGIGRAVVQQGVDEAALRRFLVEEGAAQG